MPPAAAAYATAHLRWEVPRFSRAFKAAVVEPQVWSLGHNGELFTAFMSSLVSPPTAQVDAQGREPARPRLGEFDLLTFPEAFVPADKFVETMQHLIGSGWSGCCHVGLRPRDDAGSHLFSVGELHILVGRLADISGSIASDLAAFQEWLTRQESGHFNIASLFTIDSGDKLRVCLHPKIVRSKLEVSPLPELTMTEADLLVLVTLLPDNRRFLSVTVQPLICADFLSLPTDRLLASPMEALTVHADCFGDTLPDHVDVVSVATCTPQVLDPAPGGEVVWEWHDEFRKSFLAAAEGGRSGRHHFAVVVLSNPLLLPDDGHGGLSGVFLPVKPRYDDYGSGVMVSTYGQPASGGGQNRWSKPQDKALASWRNRGFVACLDPRTGPTGADVRVFAFDVHRLPRDRSPWSPDVNLTNCRVSSGSVDDTGLLRLDPEDGQRAW